MRAVCLEPGVQYWLLQHYDIVDIHCHFGVTDWPSVRSY